MTTPAISLLEALDDPNLFKSLFARSSWDRWKVFLKALFALPMVEDELEVYRHHTGRLAAPTKPFRESALVIGRRGGKSRVLALVAVFLACFRSYDEFLAPGEAPVVAIIAADRRQSRIILRYIIGLLHTVKLLTPLIEDELAETVTLTNGVAIEVHTGSIASPRGRTFIAVLCDEIAYWSSDEGAANPDIEVIRSVRPGLLSIPTSMLLLASSPYSKRGVLWNTYIRNFGREDGRALCWQGSTLEMNPGADKAEIAEAYEEDPAAASAEYGGQFRDDLVGFIDRAIVEACVARGVFERSALPGIEYKCFVDPAGGQGRDSFALSIGHRDRDGLAVQDVIREWRPPFSAASVVEEAIPLLDAYRIKEVISDYWGAEWVGERFTENGARKYTRSERVKSALYLECLPVLTSGRCQLLDHQRTIGQIATLERRTARSGKDSIDHMPGAHDDCANATCGVLVSLAKPTGLEIWQAMGRA